MSNSSSTLINTLTLLEQGPSNQPTQPIGQSPANPITSFTRVMVDPCMMTMLEFTSIHDRIRSLTVSHHWSYMIRLPHLWSNCHLLIGRTDEDCLPLNHLPVWLRTRLSHISIRVFQPAHFIDFHLFSHVQHLSLEIVRAEIDVNTFRLAFALIHPVSFQCAGNLNVLHSSNALAALFLPPASAVGDIQPPPIIHEWVDTLEHLHLETSNPKLFASIIAVLSQCRWSRLTRLSLLLFKNANYPLTLLLDLPLGIQQLLVRSHLPELQHLWFFTHWLTDHLSYDFKLLENLGQNLREEFYGLRFYQVDMVVTDNIRSFRFPKHHHLPCSLTRLVIPQIDSISNIDHLSQLRELILYDFDYESSYHFLSLIGHHHLPLLDTLQLYPSEDLAHLREKELTSEQHMKSIQMMNEMVNLTYLGVNENVDWNWLWLTNFHRFFNLKRIRCRLQPFFTSFHRDIPLSNQLEDIDVSVSGDPNQLSRMFEIWWSRLKPLNSSPSSIATFIPIHTLSLTINWSPSGIVGPNLVSKLRHLTHLTKLIIRDLGYNSQEAMKALVGLSGLSQLVLEGQITFVTSDILFHWTRVDTSPSPFPRLGLLDLSNATFALSGVSYQQLLDGLGRLPRLHTLLLPHPTDSTQYLNDMTNLQSYVRRLNDLGRQPTLELIFNPHRGSRWIYGLEMRTTEETFSSF